MKTAGIILILFSGTGLGLCKSMELTARLKILEKLAVKYRPMDEED